jgi:oligopeptide/dipeptide ABC transporter ATP-binding protein
MTDMDKYLIQVEDLKKSFTAKKAGKFFSRLSLKAVDGVSFNIRKGETFGLVGESGCGKSTLALAMLRLIEATSGSVLFEGKDIYKMKKVELQAIRREMQVVFQDPYDSLNPRMTLKDLVEEPLIIHKVQQTLRQSRVRELFGYVGLPVELMKRYPHQLSGGQRQRLCIARSLALSPKMIVCDEAVSALDVSIQAQILNLLLDLKAELGLTYLFVSHNLSVVKFVSDRIGVMYFGKLVELADKNELFQKCLHPYTHALLSAVPNPDPTVIKKRVLLQGDVPSLYNPPAGCIFCNRCQYKQKICNKEIPPLVDVGGAHLVACHRASELDLKMDIN